MVKCSKCGLDFSKQGFPMHFQYCKGTNESTRNENEVQNQEQQSTEPSTQHTDEIQQVKLNPPEENNMSDKTDEEMYECPDCHQQFSSIPKYCSKCGCEFEE